MTNKKYFGMFAIPRIRSFAPGIEAIFREFQIGPDTVYEHEVLFASYTDLRHSHGYALVIFERDNILYINASKHCSCNGLEYSWDPQETDWAHLVVEYSNNLLWGELDGADELKDLICLHIN